PKWLRDLDTWRCLESSYPFPLQPACGLPEETIWCGLFCSRLWACPTPGPWGRSLIWSSQKVYLAGPIAFAPPEFASLLGPLFFWPFFPLQVCWRLWQAPFFDVLDGY